MNNRPTDNFSLDKNARDCPNKESLNLGQLVRQRFSQHVSSKIASKVQQKLQNHNLSDITIFPIVPSVPKVDQYFTFFKDHIPIESEKVVRDVGDTTIFTTSGVQHIETLLKKGLLYKGYKFAVTQPVIRTQFMESVENGTATSFVNFSAVSIDSSWGNFLTLFDSLLAFVFQHGVSPEDLEINVEETLNDWGGRTFHKFTVTVFVRGTEIGEAIYMSDYPIGKGDSTTITDIGIGVERIGWSLNTNDGFFPGFERYYRAYDVHEVSKIIDCIRSSTLITAEGILPGNKGAGYRTRRFIKNFTEWNKLLQLDIYEIIDISYDYWKNNGFAPVIDKNKSIQIITSEWERALNMQTLKDIETMGGKKYYIEINQERVSFLKQLTISIPRDLHKLIS